ncbi:MAG: SpoIID/LytB domain-containing protein, partial [Actinomycetes bacterium]
MAHHPGARSAPRPVARTRRRAVLGLLATAALVAATVPLWGAGVAGATESYQVPGKGFFAFDGRGFGHGIGMSQFGAEGMGRLGKSYRQILAFYYPGTTLRHGPRDRTIVVELSAADRSVAGTSSLVLRPSKGLQVVSGSSAPVTVPSRVSGARVSSVRVSRTHDGLSVRAFSRGGDVTVAAHLRAVQLRSNQDRARSGFAVANAGGATTRYRGFVDVRTNGNGLQVLNDVMLEDYLGAVVSAEDPGGWTRAAYSAQAVAARSYALLSQQIARASGRSYDICDTSWCQAYGGTNWESKAETKAVRHTAGQYLVSGGEPALTQFSSSNGGYSVAGSRGYLVAKPDPYDGVVTGAANWGHEWQTTRTAASITAAWPQIGQLRTLRVMGRDGNGDFGGRVLSVALVGSAGTVTVSGDTFRSALGLKSTWWTITNAGSGGDGTAMPTGVRVNVGDRQATVRWEKPSSGDRVRGYSVTLHPSGRTVRVGADRRSATLRHLVNGRRYTATVAAVFHGGKHRSTRSAQFVPTSPLSYFVPVTPTTVVDSGRLAARSQQTRRLLGAAGVPTSGVRAVLLRVTAQAGDAAGRVVAWPTGDESSATAAAAFGPHSGSTGLLAVGLSDSGQVTLAPSAPVSALGAQVVGYWTQSGAGSSVYRPLPTPRLIDTRIGLGVRAGPLGRGSRPTVMVAGRAGMPTTGVRAVLVNVGVVDAAGATRVALRPTHAPHYVGADVRVAGSRQATTAVVPVGADGRISLKVLGRPADVFVDVLGWFGPNVGGAAGRYRAIDPTRALTPRNGGAIHSNGHARVDIAGLAGVPADARAVAVTVRVVHSQGKG